MQTRHNTILAYIALLLAVVAILNNSSFRLGLSNVYYAAVIVSFLISVFLIINQKFQILSVPMLFVYIAGLASIMFNDTPRYYESEQRFLMFVCVTFSIGPFIGGKQINFFRERLFHCLNILLIIFSSLSYIGLATGIYRGITLTGYGTERPDFTGLFGHSMLLSPMSGIATLSCLYYFYTAKSKNMKYFLLTCALLCVLSAITAGSRSALAGLIAGALFFFYKLYRDNFGRYVRIIFLILMAGVFSFPLWEERTAFLKKKIAAAEEADDWASSRETLWEQRMKEFKSSPVFGVGFAAEEVGFSDRWDEEYLEQGGGKVEPGSSWMAVLSMTGILGLIPLLLIFAGDYTFILKSRKNRLSLAYLGALLSFFALHMFAEGYVYAFGSLLFFCLWLFLGVIEITKFEYQYIKQ